MNRDKIIAYLKNDFTDLDKDEVEKWINENRTEYNRLKYVWEKTGVNEEEEPDIGKAWIRVNPENQDKEGDGKKKIKIFLTRFQRIAAIFVLIILIGFLIYNHYAKLNRVETVWIEAENNHHQADEVHLTDGTVIWLNSASKIRYPEEFRKKTREIYLEGEAFFTVEHNKRKPFIVHTGNSITKVLGTSFNIKQEESGDVQVTVVNGSVALYDMMNDKAVAVLEKGESGIFSEQNGSVEKIINENVNFLAWKTGKLSFDKMSLADVCEILTDHYKTKVTTGDEAIKQLNLTADYDNKKLEEVLEIMQLTLNIQYHNYDSCIVLYSGK